MFSTLRTTTALIALVAIIFTTAWSSKGVDLNSVDQPQRRDLETGVEKDDVVPSDDLGIEMPDFDQADIDIDDFDDIQPTTLNLRIAGIANRRGKIIVLVFDDAGAFASYDYTAAAGYTEVSAARGAIETSIAVSGVGPYAIFLFHDANGDAELNLIGGRPVEGYGHSGSVDPYARPSFEHAAFDSRNVTVRVIYLPKRSR